MSVYTPPHLRAASLDNDQQQRRPNSRLSVHEFEDTRTMGPSLHYFYTHSPAFQRVRQMKRLYGDNEQVNQKFAQNRERSRTDDHTLAPMFRDQFYAAFSDMVDDLGGPECLLVPNATTGAARFVRRFADLGCAPGGFAQYLLTTFPQCTGVGVTHPEGYTMTYQSWSNAMQQRFPVHFADLTAAPADLAARVLPDPDMPITPPDSPSRHTRRPAVQQTNLCDVVIAGAILCNNRTRQGQPVERAARPLLAFAQLRVALSMIAPGGTLILVASANPNVFCLEILALVRRLFTSVRTTKGRKLHEIRSAYYVVGQGFKGANSDVLRQVDEAVRTLKRRGAQEGLYNPSYGGSEDDDEIGSYTSSSPTPLLLHPHLTEVDILTSDGEWFLRHYEPLWTRQADALERAFARVAKSGGGGGAGAGASPEGDRRTWRRSGMYVEPEPRSRKISQRSGVEGDYNYNAMVNAFENGLNVSSGAHTSSSSKSRRPRAEERWM